LVTVLSAIALVLIGATGFMLLGSKSETPRQPENTASVPAPLPAPAAPAAREVASPAAPFPSPNPAATPRSEPQGATYRVLANVPGGVQNLRSGPAVRYPLVVAIPAGATGITLGACRAAEDGSRPWCAAKWRSYSGFISSCCIVDER